MPERIAELGEVIVARARDDGWRQRIRWGWRNHRGAVDGEERLKRRARFIFRCATATGIVGLAIMASTFWSDHPWDHDQFGTRLVAAAVVISSFSWIALTLAAGTGHDSRVQVWKDFRNALNERQNKDIRIGGAWWVIYEGEFLQLYHRASRAVPLYVAGTEYRTRLGKESECHKQRRDYLLRWSVCIFVGWLGLATAPYPGRLPTIETVFGVLAFAGIVGSFWCVRGEYLYQRGYQAMKGAMVLDPEPPQSGLDAVHTQKPLGDERLAALEEALDAADGDNSQRSRVHDQVY